MVDCISNNTNNLHTAVNGRNACKYNKLGDSTNTLDKCLIGAVIFLVLTIFIFVNAYAKDKDYISDDFFLELIENEADITHGIAEFNLTNPTTKKLKLKEDKLKIYIKTDNKKSEELFINTKIYWKYNNTYEKLKIKEKELEPNESIIIRIEGDWEAQLGFVSYDWVPEITDEDGYKYNHTKWAFWNTDWNYYKNITITNTTYMIDDYPVVFNNFNCSSHCFSNASDLRVVNDTGSSIDFGLQINGANDFNLTFRVNPTSSATNYSVYYNTTSTSSYINKTWKDIRYNLWDDFSEANINTTRWLAIVGSGQCNSQGGTVASCVVETQGKADIINSTSNVITNYSYITLDIYNDRQDDSRTGFLGYPDYYLEKTMHQEAYYDKATGGNGLYFRNTTNEVQFDTSSSANYSLWTNVTLIRKGTTMNYSDSNDVVDTNRAISQNISHPFPFFMHVYKAGAVANVQSFWDNVYIRNYIEPEPTLAMASETSNSTWNQTDAIIAGGTYTFPTGTGIPVEKSESSRIQNNLLTTQVNSTAYSIIPINCTWNASAYTDSSDTTNFTNINVTLSSIPSGWTSVLTSWNISEMNVSDSNITNSTLSNSNNLIYWLNYTQNSLLDSIVNVGINSNITYDFYINNTDSVNYTNVILNTSEMFESGWENTSNYYLTQNINSGINNYSVNVKGEILISEFADTCPTGYGDYGSYCWFYTPLSGKDIHYYYSYLNSTSNVSKTSNMQYKILLTRLPGFETKLGYSYSINGTSSNLTNTEDSTYFYVNIPGSWKDSESLYKGYWDVNITWEVSTSPGSESTGGGGGGGIIPQIPELICPEGMEFDTLRNQCVECPSGYVYDIISGKCKVAEAPPIKIAEDFLILPLNQAFVGSIPLIGDILTPFHLILIGLGAIGYTAMRRKK